ncbi:hypothetical protein BDB00DRAFT_790271 [Zychaea mexicana]|uniref:uncharacterized protein n=1 Tax=Zychaea mexicana TaxID=64656 RepID=UPI0022FEFDE6|nr:uncharacterized protein BDB00DRAFT_790271 [Zychaea mexicana]KAI9490508.1 hypothetical protein BDB00DRAFT_790271 [Zychaea mexicana]
MSDKVVLITGATDGLGKIAAAKFLAAGNTVIITGRSETKLNATATWLSDQQQQQQTTRLYTIFLDLASLESVRQAVDAFRALGLGKIDVLINNAGTTTYEREYVAETTAVEKTVFVNAVAPWYFTQLLLPHMNDATGSRILFVTSSLHDPNVRGGQRKNDKGLPTHVTLDSLDGHIAWESMLFYKISKLTQLWLASVLGEQLKSQRIQVIALCPGFVPTTSLNRNTSWFLRLLMYYVISRMSFATSEEDAADDYVYYAHDEEIEREGFYYRKRQVAEPSEDARNSDKAKQFWNMTCDICHVPEKRI